MACIPPPLAFHSSLTQKTNQWHSSSILSLSGPDNPVFKPLHRALDCRYRELHAKGVGTSCRQTEVVTVDEEEILWNSGVLSREIPDGLLKLLL